jgi:dihydropteroate synthase
MDFAKLREIIETTIYLSLVENHEFVIKAAFGEGFAALMEIDGIEDDIKSQVNRELLISHSESKRYESITS